MKQCQNCHRRETTTLAHFKNLAAFLMSEKFTDKSLVTVTKWTCSATLLTGISNKIYPRCDRVKRQDNTSVHNWDRVVVRFLVVLDPNKQRQRSRLRVKTSFIRRTQGWLQNLGEQKSNGCSWWAEVHETWVFICTNQTLTGNQMEDPPADRPSRPLMLGWSGGEQAGRRSRLAWSTIQKSQE